MSLPWWIFDNKWNSRWSDEEQQAATRGWFTLIPTFLATYGSTVLMLNAFSIDHKIGALVGLLLSAYLALYLAGRLSERLSRI